MHRRHRNLNIPIEIIRTMIAVSETGSFTKAGERLGLSQPAISAQIKRLHDITGGPVFEKTAGGVTLTERGKIVLPHARRLLEANDRILGLGGLFGPRVLRLGLSSLYANAFFDVCARQKYSETINIHSDRSAELRKSFEEGHIDVALVIADPQPDNGVVAEWKEPLVWVRSSSFVLSPGAPIPLATWPGQRIDQIMVDALEKQGSSYRLAVCSADYLVRHSAVNAGVALMALPARFVPENLVVASEYYLPPLPPITVAIHLRHGLDASRAARLLAVLREMMPSVAASGEAIASEQKVSA